MSASDASALGRYRLIAELGRGGMADVYLALASGPAGFNKLVVVKRIRRNLVDEPDFLNMFMDEARLAARLNHPNVIQTNEVGGEGRNLFIAMEYLEGQPLNRIVARIGRRGGLSLAIHLRILIEALAGLHYAHELRDFDGKKLQVVHRDVTPHNVFVTYSGQVKVVDFGIAKAIGSTGETRAGVLKGKAAYMAPEQALGDPVDRRADIFSAGVMLWEALTDRRLFRDESDLTVLQKIVTDQIPLPRAVNPDVPERLQAICMKALSNNREDRQATAAELLSELEGALEAMGERPALRDFGAILAEQFREEEEQIKAVVEAQISGPKTPEEGARRDPSIPQLDDGPLRLPVLDGGDADMQSSPEPARSALASSSDKSDPPADAEHAAEHATPTTHRRLVQVSAPSPEAKPRWGVWLIAIAATAATAAALFFWPHAAPGTKQGEVASAVEGGSFARTLHIESAPPGATVSEGPVALGNTPLALSLDLAQAGPRQFVVSLPGYTPYTIHQGPAREDVRVVVPLMRESAAPKASTEEPSPSASHGKGPSGPVRPVRSMPSAVPSAPLPINTVR